MKGRWEKVWNMGNILWNYSTWPMGEWGIYCKVVPYWNSRGNSLTGKHSASCVFLSKL